MIIWNNREFSKKILSPWILCNRSNTEFEIKGSKKIKGNNLKIDDDSEISEIDIGDGSTQTEVTLKLSLTNGRIKCVNVTKYYSNLVLYADW